MNEKSVPKLDLTPKLKRPLSLLNPLDYLRLFYWSFFFPQAVRWYIETFAQPINVDKKSYKAKINVLRNDPVKLSLVIQTVITVVIIAGTAGIVYLTILKDEWAKLESYVFLGVLVGLVLSIALALARGVASGVVFGLTYSFTAIAVALAYIKQYIIFDFSLNLAILFSVFVGLVLELVCASILEGLFSHFVFVPVIFAYILIGFFRWHSYKWYILNILVICTLVRLLDYVLLSLPGVLHWNRSGSKGILLQSRVVFLPLPGIQKRLEKWLEMDWTAALNNVNQLLAYTLQFTPVVKAINAALSRLGKDKLLWCTASLVDRTFDWNLVRFGAVNFYNQALKKLVFFFLPVPAEPRLDTPARAACAGFWFWHEKEPEKAVEAFEVVRDFHHGPELYGIARGIVKGLAVVDLNSIIDWEQETEWLEKLPVPELRPGTLAALRTLWATSKEARSAQNSKSQLIRSTAIGRAGAALKNLIEIGEATCPDPEWPLINEIAHNWRDIFVGAGGIIGEEVLRQRVFNPYAGYSGLPVVGETFVGRADITDQIKTHWVPEGCLATLVLYGHRRMGKTSVLRNLEHSTGSTLLLVYLDMQDAGWVDHTGQLLLGFAEAVYRVVNESGLNIGTAPKEANYSGFGSGHRSLNNLLERIDTQITDQQRLILAIDEFEVIEDGINKKRIDAGLLPYLRSITQKYNWLGLIFAGLHTLEEMGRDYFSPFYSQAEYIRLGYLRYQDAIKLITQPHPDFALEYAPDLFEEIYRLTYGQPYLVQRLCWEMITKWNERFMIHGKNTPRTLTFTDLAPVLTPDFYRSAGYYFEGVWSNVTENERILMRIIAKRDYESCTSSELVHTVKDQFPKKEIDIDKTIALLCRHDVIVKQDDEVRFASELMRRWVARREN